ncbi:hypothetical protein [Neolewinella persica]|uniref:hypothetical protein n=1 Tax=Neolewinella persica TaxID=70998 RepID=UPI00146A82E6|nr:hypothetical protein [Neolewinella persica]
MRFSLLLILGLTCVSAVYGQDVEGFFTGISNRLAERDYLRVSGRLGVRAGLNTFNSPGGASRLSNPFNYGFTAGLNLDLLGINAPFMAAFANRNTTYNLPSYSFYGLSPTYKWITLHGGDRSMTFSPYSLSGVNFRGAGVELRPGKFYLGAMTGKLRRASIRDIGSIQNLETAYRRQGKGIKIGFDSQSGTELSTSLFSSVDAENERNIENDTTSLVRPERNLVLTLSGKHKLSNFLSFSAEIARSVLSRDDTAPLLPNATGRLRMFGLFTPKLTTSAASAYKFDIGLSPKFGRINLAYERVDPEYRTHGSLFFQNDFENFTGSISLPLFDKKVNLRTNMGVQRNDLDGQKASNLSRFIGAVSAAWNISDRVSTNLNLSNFNSTSRYKALTRQPQILDSIVLAQTQLSVSAGTSFLLDKAASKILMVSGSWQRAALIRNDQVDTSSTSQFSMLLVSYNFQPEGGKSTFGGSLIFNRNVTSLFGLTTLGPSLNYSRKILDERGNLTSGLSYSTVWSDAATSGGGVLQFRIGGGFAISKQQSVNLSSTLVNVASGGGQQGYSDLQLSVNYGYTFK